MDRPTAAVIARAAADDLPDDLVAPHILRQWEERYWRPIHDIATLEALLQDTSFTGDPGVHLALFSDHGVVHVRDVAKRACSLAGMLDGLFLERRPPDRLRFLRGCAVVMAYLHDIGMSPANTAGRSVHAQYASQTAFEPEFDVWIDELWASNTASIRSRIEALHAVSPLDVPGPTVLRELIALCVCHSKTVVPAELLDDTDALRQVVRRATFTLLADQAQCRPDAAPSAAADRYTEVDRTAMTHSFNWLADPHPVARLFCADVIDAIRVLRAADALRQRGSTQRTSAGFEICTNRSDGHAICTMRTEDRQIVVALRSEHPACSSEANIRTAEITAAGRLHIAFHRGDFSDADVVACHARQLADTIVDIERDALQSFVRPFAGLAEPGLVEIVRPDDNPAFADLVLQRLAVANPSLVGRVILLDGSEHNPAHNPPYHPPPDLVDWSVRGEPVVPEADIVGPIMNHLRAHGLHPSVDPERAFIGVRMATIRAGEQIMAAGTAASAVLIAMNSGIVVHPVGGYPPDRLVPWTVLGGTGAVRGAERNADVFVEETVDVLIVPIDVYLAHWFRPYDLAELRSAAQGWAR